MASGHVEPHLKAEHIAAPSRCCKREDFACQAGAIHRGDFDSLLFHEKGIAA
jgi:hypothetical protein